MSQKSKVSYSQIRDKFLFELESKAVWTRAQVVRCLDDVYAELTDFEV